MKRIIYWGTMMAVLCAATGARADATSGATISGDTITVRTDNGVATAIIAENASTVDPVPAKAKQKAELVAQAGDLDKQYAERLQSIIKRNSTFNFVSPNRASRGLVICSREADATVLAAGQEDLSIMSRILEKAAAQPRENEEREAMGIQLFTVGNGGGVKNLLIEGYGAVFMLNVNYPLTGPAIKADDDETKDRTNSAWDETKHELYGQPNGDANSVGARQEFDPKRVENLKNALLGALKNASNIRNLKSDESVTVVVTSEGGGQFGFRTEPKPRRTSGSGGGGGSSSGGGSNGGGGGGGGFGAATWVAANPGTSASGPVLTIRAKKADIDAFAKGKLTLEEFRNKSAVLLY